LGSASNSARSSVATPPGFANVLGAARKDVAFIAGTKMKQLQWDKLPQQAVGRTLWNSEDADKEKDWMQKLQLDGVWREMEEDFRAKVFVTRLLDKKKADELKSVLAPERKKNLGIIMQRVKQFSPEEISVRLLRCDPEVCFEIFLVGLRSLLPTPEEIGKLNVYRNASMEELAELHSADRFMVQLMKIDRLESRVESLLFSIKFSETFGLVEEEANKLIAAGEALQNCPHFKELLTVRE
jgi:cytokinesis protein